MLVEGESDRVAVETLTTRMRAASRIQIIAMGGATNVRSFLSGIDSEVSVLALCDAAETHFFERAGIPDQNRFVCVADLEDELIRALGSDVVLEVIEAEGHLRSFRTMQKQPAHRDRPVEAQLRRFIGSHSGFKLRYAKALTEAAVEDARIPLPLQQLVDRLDVLRP